MALELTEEQKAAGWQVKQLGELCESIDYGYTASATDDNTGTKFLRITDIKSGYYNIDSVPFVEVNDADREKYLLHDGDIVVARTGATTGVSAWIKNPKDTIFASYLVRFAVDKEKFNSRFVGYLLKSENFNNYIYSVLAEKSAQPNASAATIAKATFHVPPLERQNRVAEILGSLDDKIEANSRLLASLSELAIAEVERLNLFAGNPDKTLGDVITFSPRVSKPESESYQFIDMSVLPTSGAVAGEIGQKDTWTGSKFEEGDTLFSRITPCLENGKTAVAMGLGDQPAIGSTEFIVMRAMEPGMELFPYGIARSKRFREIATQKMTGTSGRQRVKWQDLAATPVDSSQIPEFRLGKTEFELMRSLREENIALAQTRDVLIRHLIG